MGHAESPSLIPLGLAADVSQEGSSFRWGIIASCFLHILVVVMAVFLRFQSTTEEPFRTMDVALVSLPEMQTAAPSKEKASRPTPTPAKVQSASPPKAQTREESLPPLPTQSASERLSEFLGGAIGSIVVPNKQEMASQHQHLPRLPRPNPPKDQSPLFENLRLPLTAPKLSRPDRLFPTEPLTIPKTDPPPPRETAQSTMLPLESKEPITPPQPEKVEQAVRPAPALPDLSSVTPFKKTEVEKKPNDVVASNNLEESLKRTIPTIPTPAPAPKIQRKPKPFPPQREKSSVPEMSAPQLAQIRPSQPLEKPLQREKMSEIMERLRGEVKVPNLNQSPATPLSQQPMPASPHRRSRFDRNSMNELRDYPFPTSPLSNRLKIASNSLKCNPLQIRGMLPLSLLREQIIIMG